MAGRGGRRRVLRWTLAVFGVLVAALAVLVAVQVARGKDRVARMEAIRADLSIPDDWILVDERFTSYNWTGSTACNFGNTICPELAVSYRTPRPLADLAEFEAVLPDADWSVSPRQDCSVGAFGGVEALECHVYANINGFQVRAGTVPSYDSEAGTVQGSVAVAILINEGQAVHSNRNW
jgi:hypothetical protein